MELLFRIVFIYKQGIRIFYILVITILLQNGSSQRVINLNIIYFFLELGKSDMKVWEVTNEKIVCSGL